MLLGYDSVAESILPALASRVGVLWGSLIAPEGPSPSPTWADLSQFDDVMVSEKPGRIVVNEPRWSSTIPPRRLLALRYEGVVIEDAPTLFENIQKRVCWQRLDALDLLLSPAPEYQPFGHCAAGYLHQRDWLGPAGPFFSGADLGRHSGGAYHRQPLRSKASNALDSSAFLSVSFVFEPAAVTANLSGPATY